MRRASMLSFVLAMLALMACSALLAGCEEDRSTTSVLVGWMDQDSFEYPVTRVIAGDEDGHMTVAPVAEDGSFAISLEKKHTYRIHLDTDAGNVTLALSGGDGAYGLSVNVASGGAVVDLGTIGYFEGGAPAIDAPAEVICERRGGKHKGRDDQSEIAPELAPLETLEGVVAAPSMSLPAVIRCKRSCRGDDDDDDDGRGDHDDDDHHDDDGFDDDDD